MSDPNPSTVPLAFGHELSIEADEAGQTLLLRGANATLVTIRVASSGIELRLDGVDVAVRSSGNLAVEAHDLSLHARGRLSMQAEGDAAVTVGGDLELRAQEHRVSATHGDVRIRANDDVKLDGERIFLNS